MSKIDPTPPPGFDDLSVDEQKKVPVTGEYFRMVHGQEG